jgi:hypothetical protein
LRSILFGSIFRVMKDSLLDIHFIRLATFDRAAKGLLSDADEQAMENDIAADPKGAPVVSETGGCRKIRVAIEGRGKSGGVRVLYLFIEIAQTTILLWAYPKNVSDSISAAEKKIIRKLVTTLKAEFKT